MPRLHLFTSGDAVGPIVAEALSQTLGLNIDVTEVEWSDFSAGLGKGSYPMFLASANAQYPDPEATLDALFRSTSPGNYSAYRSEDLDSALAAAATEADNGKRLAAYADIERNALDAFVVVPLYRDVGYTLVRPRVKGVTLTPLGLLSLRGLQATEP